MYGGVSGRGRGSALRVTVIGRWDVAGRTLRRPSLAADDLFTMQRRRMTCELVEGGADIRSVTRYGSQPLQIACVRVREVLEAGGAEAQ